LTGLLLLLMSVLAVVLSNSRFGASMDAFWHLPFGMRAGEGAFALPLRDWINHGLLTIFFLVVGLEIKREFTVGRLATRQAAALPVAAALGGMLVPALIYLLVVPPGPLQAGWAIPTATDTAFAVAIIALLGNRVPVELRVFLTAAVVVDDLAAIAIVAVFYSGGLDMGYLVAALITILLLVLLNRWGIYRALPCVAGIVLWTCLVGTMQRWQEDPAVVTPTRPPPTCAHGGQVCNECGIPANECCDTGLRSRACARSTPFTTGSSRRPTSCCAASNLGRATWCFRYSRWPTQDSCGRWGSSRPTSV
jgi:NhaA family Na+:H+ antiporter